MKISSYFYTVLILGAIFVGGIHVYNATLIRHGTAVLSDIPCDIVKGKSQPSKDATHGPNCVITNAEFSHSFLGELMIKTSDTVFIVDNSHVIWMATEKPRYELFKNWVEN